MRPRDSSSAGLYVFPESRVEGFFLQQLFQREVHAVTPVMMGIGRDIDAFVIRILASERLAHPHDILKLEDGPLRGGIEVLQDDGAVDPGLAELRGVTPLAQFMIVKSLGFGP